MADLVAVVLSHRRSIGNRDRRGRVGAEDAVSGRVDETVGPDVVRIRPVAERPVREDLQLPVARALHQRPCQRVPVGVAVVGEKVREATAHDRHGQPEIVADLVAVVPRHRRIVHRLHRDRHRRYVRIKLPVIGLVGEAVGAVEVGVGRVDKRAIGIEAERAVRGGAHQRRCEQRAVHVRVVGEHPGCGHRQRVVLVYAEAVQVRHRRVVRVVHRIHRDRHRGHVRIELPVIGLVGEAVAAVEVGVGRVDKRAIGIEAERAVRGGAHQRRGEHRAVHVSVVGEHPGCSHPQRVTLLYAETVQARHRGVVHRVHRDREALRRRFDTTVSRPAIVDQPHRDICGSESIGRRRKAQYAVVRHAGQFRKQSVIVGCDFEMQGLTGFIRRPRQDRRCPAPYRVRTGVLIDRLVGTYDEAWRIVDRIDVYCHGGVVGPRSAIAHLIGKCIGTVEVQIRRVGKTAVQFQVQLPMRYAGDHDRPP